MQLIPMLFLLSCFYSTNQIIPKIGDVQELRIGSSWGFIETSDVGWDFFVGQKGDLYRIKLDDELKQVKGSRQKITNVGKLKDHAFKKCPDGTYLLISSDNIETPNYFFHISADLTIAYQTKIPQGQYKHAANDVVAICSQNFKGVGAAELHGQRDFFWPFQNGKIQSVVELHDSPRLTGAALEEINGSLVVIGNDASPNLLVVHYNRDFEKVKQSTISFVGDKNNHFSHYWTPEIEKTPSGYVLASMVRNMEKLDPNVQAPKHSTERQVMDFHNTGNKWLFDTGNVYLGLLNEDLELQQWIQVTDFNPQKGGAMRPSLTLKENQMILTYDRFNQQSAHLISLE
jgi:hypothetical protein